MFCLLAYLVRSARAKLLYEGEKMRHARSVGIFYEEKEKEIVKLYKEI